MKMDFNSKTGIIIPTANRPILLERALTSVFRQSFKDWCLVIVNDGGQKEEVEDIVAYLKHKYSLHNEVVLLHNERTIGKAASCNKAFSMLKTETVIILNDDDAWSNEFLSIAVSQLEYRNTLDSQTRGIISLANVMHEEIIEDHVYIKWCDVPDEKATAPFNNFVHIQTLAVNNLFSSSQFLFFRNCIDTIGVLKEEMMILSDWEFHIRFVCTYSIFIITQPFVNIHKRFYTTETAYANLLRLHEAKAEYYSNRITDHLLRTKFFLQNSLNTNKAIQLQTILFLRLNIYNQASQQSIINSNTHMDHQLGRQIEQLVQKVNYLEHESQRMTDWFKYIDYKLQPAYIRKGKKILKLVHNGLTSKNKRAKLGKLLKSLKQEGMSATLNNIKNQLNYK